MSVYIVLVYMGQRRPAQLYAAFIVPSSHRCWVALINGFVVGLFL